MRWALIGVILGTATGLGCAALALGNSSALVLVNPANNTATNLTAPTFNGTASIEAGDASTVTVNVYSGSVASGTPLQSPVATVQLDGSWSVAASPTLADGTYTAEVTQLLNGDVTPTTSAPHTFTVDTVAPAVSLTSPANGTSTNDTTPTLGGSAGAAAGDPPTVSVTVHAGPTTGGAVVQTLTPTRTGATWTADAAALAEGTYTAVASQTDNAGNPGTSAASTFTVDTTPPGVTLNAPAAVTTDTTPGLSGAAGNASGDSDTVTVKIYNGLTTAGGVAQQITRTRSGATWNAAAGALPTGTYTAQATQPDVAGNVGTSAPHTFTITTPGAPPAPPPPPANVPPTASFVAVPSSPLTGDRVTFVSTSADPDGPIVSQVWDLNGDGVFGDATGPTATASFTTSGRHTVSLEVTDTSGARAFASQTITVAARPRPAPQLLSPFPIVRIAGRATRTGVKLRLLTAEVPAGSKVSLSCRGRSCPRRRETRVAPGRVGATRLRLVSFPHFARSLRAGVVLEIRVTRTGRIGKYTRFVVRRNAAPRRTDSCLMPGVSTAKACPAS